MYYPKSQIITNLYTNGGELMYASSQAPYVGYYFKTSTGKFYTGKTPQDIPNDELVVLVNNTDSVNTDRLSPTFSIRVNPFDYNIEKYNNLKSNYKTVLSIPTYYLPQPTPQNYQLGEFQRYFSKKSNESLYIETNKETFDKLIAQDQDWLWQLYQPFSLSWQISGDKKTVAKTNRNIVLLTMDKFKLPQFNLYLRNDYLKFYK